MSAPGNKIHRRCEKCEKVHKTGASKRWKCPQCGTWNRIKGASPLKPQKRTRYMKTGVDMYTKPKEAAWRVTLTS